MACHGREEASRRACRALEAASTTATQLGDVPFIGCVHIGSVIYGNIGSPDRLDFTVVGPTVNFVSRLEGVAKGMKCTAVCSQAVAACLPSEATRLLGTFALLGIPEEQAIFRLLRPIESRAG